MRKKIIFVCDFFPGVGTPGFFLNITGRQPGNWDPLDHSSSSILITSGRLRVDTGTEVPSFISR